MRGDEGCYGADGELAMGWGDLLRVDGFVGGCRSEAIGVVVGTSAERMYLFLVSCGMIGQWVTWYNDKRFDVNRELTDVMILRGAERGPAEDAGSCVSITRH